MAEPSNDLPPAGGAERPPSGLTRLSERVRRIIAPNPSPFTFTGTCVYIVGEGEVAVIDPGPADPAHLDALLAAIPGERVARIVVTHSHRDHAGGAALLKQRTGAPIVGARAHVAAAAPTRADASHALDYAPDEALEDGARVAGRGFTPRGGRHARPRRRPPQLRARRRERAVLRRPRDGVVDLGDRAAGRIDARLSRVAGKGRAAQRGDLLARPRRAGARTATLPCAR